MNFQNPEIKVRIIKEDDREGIDIRCHQVNDAVNEIVTFVKSRQGQLSGTIDGERYEVPISDVVYIESVDNRTFIYTAKKTYESRQKLYEFEDALKEHRFIRISKASILNLMKIKSVKPALNGRFSALLANGEEIIISRKYVSNLKDALKGGRK